MSNGLGHLDVRFALPNAFGWRVIRQGHYRSAHLSGLFYFETGIVLRVSAASSLKWTKCFEKHCFMWSVPVSSLTRSRQSALANGLYGLNSRNTEPRRDPRLQVEQSNGINKEVERHIP